MYAETAYPRVAGWAPLQALTDGRWKAIRAGGATELYDVQNDPQELRDVASAQASTAAALASRIDAIRASAAPQPGAPKPGTGEGGRAISPEAQERLRALGYVATSVQTASSSAAQNPASAIAVWNAFEDALSALNEKNPEAVPLLRRLAAENRDAPVIVATYARALKDSGALNESLAAYRDAVRRWPADATLLHDLAVAARELAMRAQGKAADALRREAARAEEAAIALAPASAMAQNGLGLLAIDQNRPGQAIPAFERATTLDPNNTSYWTNLGNARRATGDARGAEQAYRRALAIDPRAADAANGLGVLLVEAQRPAEAVPWLERAVSAAPDFVEARLNLGIALQQAGDTKRAAVLYRQLLAAPPKYKREREAAAKLLASLGPLR